ncbi:MAG: zinc carboxypeptidase [Candidatus Aminicenantes bacterium]|nr:MAG: zinc carboxypeptidase [Candidatus Aminicenantes bacterium]
MSLKLKLLVFVLLVFLLFFVSAAKQDRLPALELPTHIIGMNLDDYRVYIKTHPRLDRLSASGDQCVFLVNREEIDRIKKSGIKFTGPIPLPVSPPGLSDRQEPGDVNGRFHNYRETEEFILDLGNRYPDRAEVFSIGQSIEGRELYMIKISDNVHMDEEEPNVYFVGCHHAREWISVEVPLLFARYLLEHYPDNPEVQQVVNGAQVYILPLLNPDGLEFSIHVYRWWRKNRRYNGNYSWGVDLNRNYGYMWGYDDEGSNPDPRREGYRGLYPFSEPESSAYQQFLLAHPPAGAITYHSYTMTIMYPWGYTSEPAPDAAEMHEIAREMSERIFQVNGRIYLYGTGPELLYHTNGDHDDWVYGTFAAPSYTIELPAPDYLSGGFFVSEEEIDLSFNENLPAMLYFVDYFINKNEGGNHFGGRHPQPRKALRGHRWAH